MTVAQWHRNHIIRGLWLLAKKKVEDGFMFTWYNFKFDGDLFNLELCVALVTLYFIIIIITIFTFILSKVAYIR
jgi:hypothetical protein